MDQPGCLCQFLAVLGPCSVTTHALPLPSASPLITLAVVHAGVSSFEPRPHMPSPNSSSLPTHNKDFDSKASQMTAIDKEKDSSSNTTCSNMPSTHVTCSRDCSPFLNWNEEQPETEGEKTIVFRSLVATLKFQPALDTSLEAKTVKFLEYVTQKCSPSSDAFLSSLGSTTDDSLKNFIQCIVVLVSTPSQMITAAAMEILNELIIHSSLKVRQALVKADLIPQLISTLNPLSLSFAETINIQIRVATIIWILLHLATQDCLTKLKIEDKNEQQAVHETVFKHVLVPSEKYIWHMCMNRYLFIADNKSMDFLQIITPLLQISPSYQPTMDFVLRMPIYLAIPSFLTFYEKDYAIWCFLHFMKGGQWNYNRKWGDQRHMWKIVLRMLRMEGFEDVIEEKLGNDRSTSHGRQIVASSIYLNNLLGMNLPKRE
ncbi:hypothetical protein BLNAU_1581 [Blattamonas nauphoetae]|uniref:Uncharacterized protein n=1 Tax=Blattamonas nauphoetae TaxID=2049346 RepID=A0ABQ9YIG1_9EUKA|nr:hypothetical protein BLNAU_1581 [Blattamonas nauphoetae]